MLKCKPPTLEQTEDMLEAVYSASAACELVIIGAAESTGLPGPLKAAVVPSIIIEIVATYANDVEEAETGEDGEAWVRSIVSKALARLQELRAERMGGTPEEKLS